MVWGHLSHLCWRWMEEWWYLASVSLLFHAVVFSTVLQCFASRILSSGARGSHGGSRLALSWKKQTDKSDSKRDVLALMPQKGVLAVHIVSVSKGTIFSSTLHFGCELSGLVAIWRSSLQVTLPLLMPIVAGWCLNSKNILQRSNKCSCISSSQTRCKPYPQGEQDMLWSLAKLAQYRPQGWSSHLILW